MIGLAVASAMPMLSLLSALFREDAEGVTAKMRLGQSACKGIYIGGVVVACREGPLREAGITHIGASDCASVLYWYKASAARRRVHAT